ncbi:RNA pseudouridine synthase, partial [Oscillospiraceae bacterium OttesenSCG-928-G22]|nr:RNA pseudouridine synthase [Oscillospiraceae bacterium OttesenSCG-928-G22]
AKNDRAHASLAEQLKERTFSRVYEAVVRGRLPEHSGRIDAPVARHPSHRKKMAVNRIAGKPAATRYEVIAEYAGYSYIRCILETGRTHQIRVHMAHVGHPVTGDTVYGGGDEFHIGGQCLHAKSAAFTHPSTGERLTFAANLPDYFEKVLTILRNRS